MNDKDNNQTGQTQSWLERLNHALLREPKDREQLLQSLRDAESRKLLDTETLTMLEGVLTFADMQVRDIMIPRSQMVTVTEEHSLPEILTTVVPSGHSRFPVLDTAQEEIVGILHAKDLLSYMPTQETFEMDDILRPPVFVPESKRLNVLLAEFRANRNHMAIVVDEYGSIAGFVTIEDVIEQIIGDIEDEFDIDEEAFVKKHSETQFIVKAHMPIEEFNEHFPNPLATDTDSIGGLVVTAFGYVPKRNESIRIDHYQFKIVNCDSRRIRLLQVDLV